MRRRISLPRLGVRDAFAQLGTIGLCQHMECLGPIGACYAATLCLPQQNLRPVCCDDRPIIVDLDVGAKREQRIKDVVTAVGRHLSFSLSRENTSTRALDREALDLTRWQRMESTTVPDGPVAAIAC